MIKVEVIEKFSLERFDELVNLERAKQDIRGKLNIGDKFECSKDLADYLLGNNPLKKAVVKIIEVQPIKEEVIAEPIIETPKKSKKTKK